MSQCTVKATAEELFFHCCGNAYSADVELEVSFDLQPEEKQTRDYPGCPATVEMTGWKVVSVDYFDTDGFSVKMDTLGDEASAIANWVSENEEYLSELACEQEADKAEEWGY